MRFLKPSDIHRGSYQDPHSDARCIRGWVIHFVSDHWCRHDFYHELHEQLHKIAHLFSFEVGIDTNLATINDKCVSDLEINLLCGAFNNTVTFFRREFK